MEERSRERDKKRERESSLLQVELVFETRPSQKANKETMRDFSGEGEKLS